MSTDSEGYFGSQEPNAATSEYNAQQFLILSVLAGRNHCALVQITAVTNAGELAKVGFVDVQPMVNQLDGQGNATPHGVINGIPYLRMQGGANAIILDPQVGDIGIAVFADRDIQSVKASAAIANPGSMAQGSWSDGLYIGGVLNGVPSQYVQFNAAGIKIFSPTAIHLEAPAIELVAATSITATTPLFQISGNVTIGGTATAAVDVIGGGKSLKSHVHTGVASGASNTGPPA